MNRRTRLLEILERLDEVETEASLTVSLQDYFEGNTDEESIAPNQWGEGRPTIAELYDRFRSIEERPDVQCVLVGLHCCWYDALQDDSIWPAAENVRTLTSAPESEVETWIVGLKADGLFVGWPYGEHPMSPRPNPGYQVYSVCWD